MVFVKRQASGFVEGLLQRRAVWEARMAPVTLIARSPRVRRLVLVFVKTFLDQEGRKVRLKKGFVRLPRLRTVVATYV